MNKKPTRENCLYRTDQEACNYPGLFDSKPRDPEDKCENYTRCDRYLTSQKKKEKG